MPQKLIKKANRTRLPKNYQPSDDEPFMNARQREYFRKQLENWKKEINDQLRSTVDYLQTERSNHPDPVDVAAHNTDRQLELRARDRQRKLMVKINQAIARIDNKTYGYCEDTGEPIKLERLKARPVATLSLEAQERHENSEKRKA